MGNVAVVSPAGTITLGGTAAAAPLLLASETSAPPTGAEQPRTTRPTTPTPPRVTCGLSVNNARGAGCTISVVMRLAPSRDAVSVTVVSASTAPGVTVKLALVVPSATVTPADTWI